jgi:hypothetical protein
MLLLIRVKGMDIRQIIVCMSGNRVSKNARIGGTIKAG